ncbi:hypothetical protein GCM10008932_00340 [Alkalibacterium iburiense]|uniref:Uncharacterized protein n=1 Tax=Alkalibacterium iburiense TaxID=290589 RepID=A0ABN0WZF3_9LACT
MVQDNVKWLIEVVRIPLDIEETLQTHLKGVQQILLENNTIHLIVDPIEFQTPQLMRVIAENQIELVTLKKEELSLEEAFLQLTGKTLRD